MKRIFYILIVALSIFSCTDEIDKSNRYTFTGETVADFMLNRSDKYSHMITLLKRANLFGLLATYGQYTLFLPDNEGVEKYIQEQDSIYQTSKDSHKVKWTGITSPYFEDISDSMANVIARNHLVEGYYNTVTFEDGALPCWNFYNRYLGISYESNPKGYFVKINNSAAIIDRDNSVENGVIHIVDKIVEETNNTLPEQIGEYKFFTLFNAALEATCFCDSLTLFIDDNFIPLDEIILASKDTPQQKYYKYTGFIEPDEVFNKYGIYTLDDLKAFAQKWYGNEDKDNYRSPKNALNKFVTYHFVPRELAYNDVVFHNIRYTTKYSGRFDSERLMVPGFDRYDYFETMQGRLMKVIKPLSTIHGSNIYINFSKRELPSNINMHPHINVRIIPLTEFVHSNEMYAKFDQMASNGIIHPIDKILIYNEDEMVGNILNERIRIDVASLLPELSSNGLRFVGRYSENLEYPAIPDGYAPYLKIRDGLVQYLVTFYSYFRDALVLCNNYDISLRIPPLPARTYEIRFGYFKGLTGSSTGSNDNIYRGKKLVQIYIDGKIASSPEDYGISNYSKGAVPDSETYDYGLENDKFMRNVGWMKAPDCYKVIDNYGGDFVARHSGNHTRRIINRRYLDEKEHWIRFRNVGESGKLLLDYLEFVPLNIISDPTKPEDRH